VFLLGVDLLGLELGLSSEGDNIVTAIRPKFRNLLIFLRNTRLSPKSSS
jgi:hypothetical protein